MRQPRRFTYFLFGLFLAVAACYSEQGMPLEPEGPSLASGPGKLGTLLLSCRPLPYSVSSASIGSNGGTLKFGPHTLVVPKGALRQTVTIRAEVLPGTANSVRFSPKGLGFGNGGAALTLSYSNCSGPGMLLPKQVAYTDEELYVLYLLKSVDNLVQKKVTGQLQHFSRYAVAY